MKSNSYTKIDYSEKKMVDLFINMLKSSSTLSTIGPFDEVFREVSCYQGRPDFIGLRNTSSCEMKPFPKVTGFVGASLLSLLKPNSQRTLKYLLQKSEFTEKSIIRSLKLLLKSGHIEQTKTGSYVLGAASCYFNVELWAFEFKLNNPKRAVYQAQQSRAFAERSIIVVPPGQEKNYQRYNEIMNRWSIGLVTFDPYTKDFSIIKWSRKSSVFSREQQVYTIIQLYSLLKNK